MSKENNVVVSEVVEVLSSIEVELNKQGSISFKTFETLKEKLTNLINDYLATIKENDRLNSLESKLEDFIEVIGMMCTVSVSSIEGLENLNNITSNLKNSIFMKQK